MELFTEQGKTRLDCEYKIRKKYGERFIVHRQRTVPLGGWLGFFTREGVELEFYIPPQLSGRSYSQNNSASPMNQADFEEEKKKVIAAGRDSVSGSRPSDAAQNRILEELKEIKQIIDSASTKTEEHPSLKRMAELLRLNDFTDAYISKMLEKARSELSLEILDNFNAAQERLVEWIGESILICKEPFVAPRSIKRPAAQIIALVGPTGVGKTTTIAKLAANFGLDSDGSSLRSVRMITIDAFRIGARAQIESFGEIMRIPVTYVDNRRDLRKEIAISQDDNDLILIDTIGKSPKDSAKLGEMKEFLDVCGSGLETHLVISAGTKASDVSAILQQFEPFNYRSVIISKLDETIHVGNIISALGSKGKPVSYITDGQKVPSDIKRASVVRFLMNLDEFTLNRDKMEKRFPVEADKFIWN